MVSYLMFFVVAHVVAPILSSACRHGAAMYKPEAVYAYW